MSAVTVYALTQRTEAREQARNAKANELEANADALLASDPELSVLLATEAADSSRARAPSEPCAQSLLDSRVRAVADVGEPLLRPRAQGASSSE